MEKPLRVILLAFQPQAIKLFFSQIDLSKVHLLAVFSDQGESIRITTPRTKQYQRSHFLKFCRLSIDIGARMCIGF